MPRPNGNPPALRKRLAQALALHEQGRLAPAEQTYTAILAQHPDCFEALYQLAVLTLQTDRAAVALGLLNQAVAIDPGSAAAHGALGSALVALRRPRAAITSFDTSIALDPHYAEDHYNRGKALQDVGDHAAAATSYARAIALRPDFADAYINQGTALQAVGRHQDARRTYDLAIAARPDHAELYYNRGNAFLDLARYPAAIEDYDRAIHLDPNHAKACCNRGIALQALDRHQQALASFNQAIALRPDFAEAYSNRGLALYELKRHDEALANYDGAISLQPDFVDPNWNKALLLLRLGRLEPGWRQFEWRKKLPHPIGYRQYKQPLWLGQPNIAGKTLFIYWEQGFGDTLQFCRYASLVQDTGAQVVLSVQDPLLRLIRLMDSRIEVVGGTDPLPAFDYHCPLMSLPLALGTTLQTIPSAPRYLHADHDRHMYWRTRVSELPGLKVGLAWAGSPREGHRQLELIDRRRSIALATCAPLANVTGVSFVSLQKGPSAARTDAPPPGLLLHDWTDDLDDFADTAALAEALDLVISVDTAVAHLTAALGKPLWLLNRFDTCWRWLEHRRDSPWYPSARLFRQPRFGDWSAVIDEVCAELQAAADRAPAVPPP